jgi:hypothetical protein
VTDHPLVLALLIVAAVAVGVVLWQRRAPGRPGA